MSTDEHSIEILADLVKDAIRRIDVMADRVDHKLDSFDRKYAEDYRIFKDNLEEKVKSVSEEVRSVSNRIQHFESSAKVASWLVTGGLASLVAFLSWASGLIKFPTP